MTDYDDFDDLNPDDIDEFDDLDADEPAPHRQQIYRIIKEALPRHRPDGRYDRRDKRWMKPVIDGVYEVARQYQVTSDELIQDLIRSNVMKQEREAVRATNKLLRKIGREGQLPLGWPTFLDGNDDSWKNALRPHLQSPLALSKNQRIPLGAACRFDFDEANQADKDAVEKANQARAEREAGYLFFVRLFEAQGNAFRADQLRQPGE